MAILDRRVVATRFAVPARLMYDKSREIGVGTEVDSSMFMQYDDDLRAIRNAVVMDDKQQFIGH